MTQTSFISMMQTSFISMVPCSFVEFIQPSAKQIKVVSLSKRLTIQHTTVLKSTVPLMMPKMLEESDSNIICSKRGGRKTRRENKEIEKKLAEIEKAMDDIRRIIEQLYLQISKETDAAKKDQLKKDLKDAIKKYKELEREHAALKKNFK